MPEYLHFFAFKTLLDLSLQIFCDEPIIKHEILQYVPKQNS